jgi:PST family polysaccharide transporter
MTSRSNTAAQAERAPSKSNSYGEIFKASALIGSSTLFKLAIGIVRTKAMAMWLGPTGFGLLGVYSSIADLAQILAGMGIDGSGVRQVAAAVSKGDQERIARAVLALRRTVLLLGLLGAAALAAFAGPVSMITFGDDDHITAIRMLSATVLFTCLSSGQTALIQGMRRIGDLVKIGIFGAVAGAIVGLPIIYALRSDGIVLSLVCGSAISLVVSWWYSRKISLEKPSMTFAQISGEAAELLKLGSALMAGSLMLTGASYATRLFILQKLGLEAAGLYQAAWSLGGVYIGVILGSVGTDFYPRVVAVVNDNATCNRLVNEQTLAGVLMAAPGIIATLTLAPLALSLLYSPEFQQAVDLLRWLCLGMVLRVLSWPMGYLVIAKGARRLFFWTELPWYVVYVALTYASVSAFGLNGAGIAFFIAYALHVVIFYLVIRFFTGFRYSAETLKLSILFMTVIVFLFSAHYFLPHRVATMTGLVILAAVSIYSSRSLINLVSPTAIPRPVFRMLERVGFIKAAP